MNKVHHILTLLGASGVAVGSTAVAWARVASTPEVGVPGYAMGPSGQVALALAVLLGGMAMVRLAGRRPGLEGATALTGLALLVWVVASWALASVSGAELLPGPGMAVALAGSALAAVAAAWAHARSRLRVQVEVTQDGHLVEARTLTRPGTWSAIVPGSSWAHGRPAAFHVDDDGAVAVGVRAEDMGRVRVAGQSLHRDRWFGDANSPVRAFELLPGDWGVCRSGGVETRFEVRGSQLRSRPDTWAVAGVATALFMQIGLMGMATEPWHPESLALHPASSRVLLEERPAAQFEPAAGVAPRPLMDEPLKLTIAKDLWIDDLPRQQAARGGAFTDPLNPPPGSSVARGLTELLANPTEGSPVAQVLRRDGAREARLGRLFETGQAPTLVTDEKALAYKGTQKQLTGPEAKLDTTSPAGAEANRLSSPKTKRRVSPRTMPTRSAVRVNANNPTCRNLNKDLKRRTRSFQACIDARSAVNPSLKGQVRIDFTLNLDGRLEAVKVQGNTTRDRALTGCLLRRLRQLRAAQPEQACRGSVMFHLGH